MSRKVTISSLGQAPPRFPGEEKFLDYNAMSENMIAFWQRQIAQVAPDRPDVIVLPENCDRYFGAPLDEKLKLREAMGDRMLESLQKSAREKSCTSSMAPRVRRRTVRGATPP